MPKSKYLLRFEIWLRKKDSNLHLRVQSPTCYQLHHPAKSRMKDEGGRMKLKLRNNESSSFIFHPSSLLLEAMKGFEPLSFGLQDRCSVIHLSYIAGVQ